MTQKNIPFPLDVSPPVIDRREGFPGHQSWQRCPDWERGLKIETSLIGRQAGAHGQLEKILLLHILK